MITDDMLSFDREHILHPYSSMTKPLKCYGVEKAQGVYLYLSNGKKVIDAMSSWWCVIHGYNNAYINKAIAKQLDKVSHVMFGGLTHEPAIAFAKKLLSITPQHLQKVFFCDSGSVAIEVAMKMALQYQYAKKQIHKNKFATFRGGYHGDTANAMSVCDPVNGMHSIFSGAIAQQMFLAKPSIKFDEVWNEESSGIANIRKFFKENSKDLAAFILEPIVQGAGGMNFYHKNYLKEIYNLCKEYDVLLIVDEIATGFGRSGKMFACDYVEEVHADIMCLGKAITGGYMSFAGVLTTEDLSEAISNSQVPIFMHGPTFMANPLACAAASASFDVFMEGNYLPKIKEIEKILKDEFKKALSFDNVEDVRVLGSIGVIYMKENVDMASITEAFIQEGVWLRPFGKLVYVMPAYIITKDELVCLCRAVLKVLGK